MARLLFHREGKTVQVTPAVCQVSLRLQLIKTMVTDQVGKLIVPAVTEFPNESCPHYAPLLLIGTSDGILLSRLAKSTGKTSQEDCDTSDTRT